MHLAGTTASVGSIDLVVEPESGQPAIELRVAHANDPKPLGLDRSRACVTRLHGLGREPRLHDHDAIVGDVLAKTLQRPTNLRQGPHIPDGAEQAYHRVVMPTQVKVGHVRFVEPTGRKLGTGNPNERGVEIQAVNLEAMMRREKMGVFPSAAGHVEYGAATRVNLTQEFCELAGLGWVV